jgi:hypothetical protein
MQSRACLRESVPTNGAGRRCAPIADARRRTMIAVSTLHAFLDRIETVRSRKTIYVQL